MMLEVKINEVKSVNQLADYWSEQDYRNLLEEFGFPDAKDIAANELREMLFMAITDFEPADAAEVTLTYKLSDKLNEGQIQNIAHEMLLDKVAEEYSDPALHFDLFNINQLLYHAYNGKFPNTIATIISLELRDKSGTPIELSKEILLKSIQHGLKDNNLVHRLYEPQLDGTEAFGDAAKVIWRFEEKADHTYEILTSNYFIEDQDFTSFEFDAAIVFHEEED